MSTYSFPVIQAKETGMRLRKIRKEKKIRVAVVCDYMGGISEQAVYKWERGACLPTIDNLLALSHLYDVRMEDLLDYEEVEMASFSFAKKYPGARKIPGNRSIFIFLLRMDSGITLTVQYAQHMVHRSDVPVELILK